MAEAPPSTRSTDGAVGPAAMASTTSRTWKLIASTMARARWARPDAPAEPEDGAPGPRVPVGAPEPGEGRDHHHTLAGLDRAGQRLELGGLAR